MPVEEAVMSDVQEGGRKLKQTGSLCEHSIRGGCAGFRVVPAGSAPPDDGCMMMDVVSDDKWETNELTAALSSCSCFLSPPTSAVVQI